jgi:hypothetical protein
MQHRVFHFLLHVREADMKTTTTMPGSRQELDMRYCVTLEPEELPWPLRFYFLRTEEGAWSNVSFEMGIGAVPRDAFGESGRLEIDDQALITPSAVRWVQKNFFHFRAIAESRLNTDRVVRSKSDGVTPEALAYLASEWRDLGGQRGAVNHLAAIHGVSRTTIWRRLKRAGVERPGRTALHS